MHTILTSCRALSKCTNINRNYTKRYDIKLLDILFLIILRGVVAWLDHQSLNRENNVVHSTLLQFTQLYTWVRKGGTKSPKTYTSINTFVQLLIRTSFDIGKAYAYILDMWYNFGFTPTLMKCLHKCLLPGRVVTSKHKRGLNVTTPGHNVLTLLLNITTYDTSLG